MKRKRITKSALALSILLMIVWMLLGTTSTIAWFSDSDTIVNTLQFGNLQVELYHKVGSEYQLVTAETKLFDDEALYEPGYTQVIYLKVKNVGDVPFDYKLSVVPSEAVLGKNLFGESIYLPDHLKFGIVVKDTEEAVLAATQNRTDARSFADTQLNNYDEVQTDLAVDAAQFIALVVCMPEEVGNEANFRGTQASVDLGVNVKATQIEARGQL